MNSGIQIPSHVASCGRHFHSLIKALPNAPRFAAQIKLGAINDEFDRFKVWAGNIAAHRNGRRSLEYRLRDAPHLKDETCYLLTALKESLQNVLAIVTGERIPWDESAESDSESESDAEDTALSGDTELKLLLESIENTITCLFRLSVAIRDPASESQFRSTITVDKSHFHKHDIQHVEEKFKLAKRYLIDRLGVAISGRRSYLTYREEHNQKLSKHVEVIGIEEPRTEHTTNSTEATPMPAVSGALKEMNVIDDGEDILSQTSYATTVKNISLRVPRLPKEAQEQEHFECPLCFMIVSIHTYSVWKRHVFRDLHPYCCTFEECATADRLYDSRHAWFKHELEAHRAIWQCIEGCEKTFAAEKDFVAHVAKKHPEIASDDILSVLKRTAVKSANLTKPSQCPLCDKVMSLRALQKHLGNHQEQLALFALPLNIDATEDEEEDSNYAKNHGKPNESPSSDISEGETPDDDGGHSRGLRQFPESELEGLESDDDFSSVLNDEELLDPREGNSSVPDDAVPDSGAILPFDDLPPFSHITSAYLDAGRADAPYPLPAGSTPAPPPAWLTSALQELREKYPNDNFEAFMRYSAVDQKTQSIFKVDHLPPGAPLPSNVKTQFLPRIRCIDCPGKLYTAGPGLTVENFEVHLRNRQHKAMVEKRTGRPSASSVMAQYDPIRPDDSIPLTPHPEIVDSDDENPDSGTDILIFQHASHGPEGNPGVPPPPSPPQPPPPPLDTSREHSTIATLEKIPFDTQEEEDEETRKKTEDAKFSTLKQFIEQPEEEEARKKVTEAKKAKKVAEKEAARMRPTGDDEKPTIKFKDAVGRKFSFPWHLCKTWKGMEELIKQAFLHVDVIGPHVHEGHYDLVGPDGEIILPQAWETIVQPDWAITMHMWPMPEPPPPPGPLENQPPPPPPLPPDMVVMPPPSPSPPPFIPQQTTIPSPENVSPHSLKKRKKPNRRKTRPSQGDTVLISFLDPNRPDIARLVGERALNSDSGSEADDEEMEERESEPATSNSSLQTAPNVASLDLVGTAQAALQTAENASVPADTRIP